MEKARRLAAAMSACRRPFDFHGALQSTAASPKTMGASVLWPEGYEYQPWPWKR